MKKINPRLAGRGSHVGGPVASNSLDPMDLSDDAIKEKRAAREEEEDLELFKEY